MRELTMEELNKITEAIIGTAIEVHRHLGPDLLESACSNTAALRDSPINPQKNLRALCELCG